MEFFVYCRDRPGVDDLRDELVEAHWAYMDDFADQLIARGPTLTDDRETATGSVHIVDLPDAGAARAFAYEEPNFKAGVYDQVDVRRWRNESGRTMWDVEHRGGLGFLYVSPTLVTPSELGGLPIVWGTLLADDGLTETGSAGVMEAATPASAAGVLPQVTIMPWERGGRR